MDKAKEKKMEAEIKKLYDKYNLIPDDVFRHKNYIIITRSGIEKIIGIAKIEVTYELAGFLPTHVAVKATGKKGTVVVETFGSAKQGGGDWVPKSNGSGNRFVASGNTESWYLTEIAEKRAMSRVALKIEGLYELGVFGEDESEDFKKTSKSPTVPKETAKSKSKEEPKAEEKKEPTPTPEVKEKVEEAAAKIDEVIPAEAEESVVHKVEDAITALGKCENINELKLAWELVKGWGFGQDPQVIAKKDELKTKLK